MCQHVFEQACAGVVPVALVVLVGVQHPRPIRVEVAHTLCLELRDIQITQHRQNPAHAELVAALLTLDVGREGILLAPHLTDVCLDQHVALHQQESVGQQVEELVDGHHVAVRAPAVDSCMSLGLVGECCQSALEVYHLSFGVVYHFHALHLAGERVRLDSSFWHPLAGRPCHLAAIVEHHHGPVYAVLPD